MQTKDNATLIATLRSDFDKIQALIDSGKSEQYRERAAAADSLAYAKKVLADAGPDDAEAAIETARLWLEIAAKDLGHTTAILSGWTVLRY